MVKSEYYDIYTEYYLNQAGSGFSNVYAGPMYQKGYGIGSFLGGLFRSVYPILKKGAAIVGSELLKSGSNIISDIAGSQDPQVVIKKRGKETINNLSKLVGDKMFGAGYKSSNSTKRSHTFRNSGPVKDQKKTNSNATNKKLPKKNKKKCQKRGKTEVFDIFS